MLSESEKGQRGLGVCLRWFLLSHTSTPACTTAERAELQTLQWYRMDLWFGACPYAKQKDETAGGWSISQWVSGRGESSILCCCKLTFICQGPIHKNISFMITSGAQRNDNRVLQRKLLMTQWETFSQGPHRHSAGNMKFVYSST